MSLRNWAHLYSAELEVGKLSESGAGLECHCCHRTLYLNDWVAQRSSPEYAIVHYACSNNTEAQILTIGDLPWSSEPPEGWRLWSVFARRYEDADDEILARALEANILHGMVASPHRGGIGHPYVRAVTSGRVVKQMGALLREQAVQRLRAL